MIIFLHQSNHTLQKKNPFCYSFNFVKSPVTHCIGVFITFCTVVPNLASPHYMKTIIFLYKVDRNLSQYRLVMLYLVETMLMNTDEFCKKKLVQGVIE